MKKVFSVLAIATVFVATSCSKVYTCEVGGTTIEYDSKDYTDLLLDAAELACDASGGTWGTK